MPKNERPFSHAPDEDGASEGNDGASKGKPKRANDKRERILRAAIQVFAAASMALWNCG